MRRRHFPWILAGILLVSWAAWHAAGLVLAVAALAVVYLSSVRLNPRTRHGRCNGSGEHHSWLFPWVFRKCGRCNSGRVVRWGAGQWGSPAAQAERTRTRAANQAARDGHRWR